MKYSKSGAIEPATNAVAEIRFFPNLIKGKIIAGCENVNGIYFNYFFE